jgi:hypothetical protein
LRHCRRSDVLPQSALDLKDAVLFLRHLK